MADPQKSIEIEINVYLESVSNQNVVDWYQGSMQDDESKKQQRTPHGLHGRLAVSQPASLDDLASALAKSVLEVYGSPLARSPHETMIRMESDYRKGGESPIEMYEGSVYTYKNFSHKDLAKIAHRMRDILYPTV